MVSPRKEAIDALRDTQYAAVISDVRLPDVTGEQVFAVANQSITMTPPFFFITAFASVENAVAMLKRGAADYITKPFDITELVTKVRTLVGVHAQPVDTGKQPWAFRRACEPSLVFARASQNERKRS